ncbi:hypothetical protein [Palleronia abyssalis]|uniref:hypothetical protein n=1 Tax=Palleronia abyssalis TaxID=1501240 RepID=UPI0011B28A18|nr:hypothetical protein [Palleronia abyssalis]
MFLEDPKRPSTLPSHDFMAAFPYAHVAYTLDMAVIDLNWRHGQMTGGPREAAVRRNPFKEIVCQTGPI